MPLSRAIYVDAPVFHVENHPSEYQLQHWWRCLMSDPRDIATAYADSFPSTLSAFLERVDIGLYHHHQLICVGNDVAGAFWLHDLMTEEGHVYGGWLGGYALPAYRRFAGDMWQSVKPHLLARGVRHVFAAVHQGNKRSRMLLSQVLRFHRAGSFEAFTWFAGQPVSVVIYCMHADDAPLAMLEADQRASRNLQQHRMRLAG